MCTIKKSVIDKVKSILDNKEFAANKILSLIEIQKITVLPESYIGVEIHNIYWDLLFNQAWTVSFARLSSINRAFENLCSYKGEDFALSTLKPLVDRISGVEVKSKAAEITSHGILLSAFPNTEPITERNEKTPDFKCTNNLFVEVYCPQKSEANRKYVQKQFDQQFGALKLAVSHPLTGAGKGSKALHYPTNKFIDRVLNAKWNNDQTYPGMQNLLWLDLVNGLEMYCKDTQQLSLAMRNGETYIGSIGIWHAFYGKKESSRFLNDRTSLKDLVTEEQLFANSYVQQRDGLFRIRKSISAAILYTIDGVVLFENHLADVPLDAETKGALMRLDRYREDFSFSTLDAYCKEYAAL